MNYEQARFYFMSGAGNTFRVAQWMAARAGPRREPPFVFGEKIG